MLTSTAATTGRPQSFTTGYSVIVAGIIPEIESPFRCSG